LQSVLFACSLVIFLGELEDDRDGEDERNDESDDQVWSEKHGDVFAGVLQSERPDAAASDRYRRAASGSEAHF